jgi:hypothetical protein
MDGPFTQTSDLVAGYCLRSSRSKKRSNGSAGARLRTARERKVRSSFASSASWGISLPSEAIEDLRKLERELAIKK